MAKSKASEPLPRRAKKINSSTHFVYYQPALHPKIWKVSSTKIGKRPIYRLFIDCNGQYFPLKCMLDLGSTSFVISPEAAKAFSIPLVKQLKPLQSGDLSDNNLETEGLFIILLGVYFGNYGSYDEEHHAFEVVKTSKDYDALIPA
jgi:hypothetical protein